MVERGLRYKTDLLLWIQDYFGDNIKKAFREYTGFDSLTRTGLTIQQEEAARVLGEFIDAKLAVYYKQVLTERQMELSKKIGISIMSGTGTGKDFFIAIIILFFVTLFKDSRVTATANSAKQLRNVLWTQIARVMDLSIRVNAPDGEMPILRHLFEYQAEKVFLKEGKGTGNFIEGVTCNASMTVEEQAEVLGGRHAKYMISCADEATGIPDGVFKPLEGTLTGAVNFLFLIFNPTKTKGFAIDSQYGDRSRWVTFRWNAEDSEIVTKSSIELMEEKYGRDSTPFRIRVLGLPPLADSDALIPYEWIDDAINRSIEPLEDDPLVVSLDCGAGGDKSVLCALQGGKVFPFKRNNSADSMELVGWAVRNTEDADVLVVDKKGIGHGIFGRLREIRGWRVKGYDGSAKARREDQFYRKRDEAYMTMREKFELGILDIPDDRDFIDQLSAIRMIPDSSGRMHVMTKSQVKKKIGQSPDEVDSLVMALDVDSAVYRKMKEDPDEIRKRMREERMANRIVENSWMGV